MTDTRPTASLSLDLDNLWSYMKTHGDEGWENFPSYLDVAVPRILEILERLDLRITFFIVGQDAALEKNHQALRLIAEAGHEIGNHSFHHEPWLHLYKPEEIREEIIRAGQAIETATGVRPTGWRGPGFSFSRDTLEVLAERGYPYDASTFPTYLGPLARAYYFMTSGLDKEEREKRNQLFGTFSEGRRPLKPYLWDLGGKEGFLEMPVTTMPIFRLPFHLSYLLYLGGFSPIAARSYLEVATRLCLLSKTPVSYLLHPLDFLGKEDAPELEFFPAMRMSGEAKCALAEQFLGRLSRSFQFVAMGEHSQLLKEAGSLPTHTAPAPSVTAAPNQIAE